jgi:hypothetical protein
MVRVRVRVRAGGLTCGAHAARAQVESLERGGLAVRLHQSEGRGVLEWVIEEAQATQASQRAWLGLGLGSGSGLG